MDGFSKYYPFLINLGLIALVNIGSAIVVSDLLSWYLYMPPEINAVKKIKTRIKHKTTTMVKSDLRQILKRNFFCSDCDPISLDDLFKSVDAKSKKLPDSFEGAKLLTTMVSDKAKWSLAFLSVEKPEVKVIRVAVGDKVGSAEITTIEDKKVTLIKEGKEYVLNLMGETKEPPKNVKTKKNKKNKLNSITSKIKKVGPNKYEIEKSVVQDLMKNFAAAGRGARVVPDPKGGFRASFVRHYSIFYKLGVRSGDVIKSVNNIPLNSIQETLLLYTKLKNASHLTMSLNRRGKTVNMDYTIR